MSVAVIVPLRTDGDEHRQRSWEWVEKWWRTHFSDWALGTADSGHQPFNRGASRNMAAKAARHYDILVIADADTIPDADAVARGVQKVRDRRAPWVIPYSAGRYYNLAEKTTMRRLRFPPDRAVPIHEPWDEDDYEHKLTSWAGCLIVRREDYFAAGGYPEFSEWGYEDDCFRTALDQVAGHHERIDGFCLHLWHTSSEDNRFGNPQIEANRDVFLQYKRAHTQQAMTRVIEQYGGLSTPT